MYAYFSSLISFCVLADGFGIIVAFAAKDVIEAAQSLRLFQFSGIVVRLSVAVLIVFILTPLFRYIYTRATKAAMADLRLRVFNHIEKLPVSYYERNHGGDFISRMTNDIQVVEDTFLEVMYAAVSVLISGILTVAAMLALNWMMAAVLIIAGCAFTMVNSIFSRILRRYSDGIQKQQGRLIENVTDILAGFSVLRIFQLGNILRGKFNAENRRLTGLNIQRIDKVALLDSINYLLNMLNFAGIFAVGSIMVAYRLTGFGTLTAMVILQTNLEDVIQQTGEIIANLQRSMAGAARVFAILDEPAESDMGAGSAPEAGPAHPDLMIEARELTFGYQPGERALDGLEMTVARGKTAAIVGPSGGGKSTIAKLLLGFYPASQGEIMIGGRPITAYSLEQLRGMIAYVPQDLYLFKGTIAENIGYGKPGASQAEIINAARIANADEFIRELPGGYHTDVGETGNKLSGGERQRIAIARAVLKDAPILLLDEATSALDLHSERLIREALDKLRKDRTFLIVAHRLSTIENADIIYVVAGGRVVESGKHHELVRLNGLYSFLYETQFRQEA
jgi:ATP-binding cassette subfamily B protein